MDHLGTTPFSYSGVACPVGITDFGHRPIWPQNCFAWQEYGILISTADRDAFITHARKIAADHKIYLLISMAVMDMTGTEKGENVSIFIDPAGNIQWKYLKSYLVPGIEKPYFKEGDKIIPVLRTPFTGRWHP